MSRQKKILLDNAYSAWGSAIRYCNQILEGRATFECRKNFVSSLQNAVELFLKQIMLDNNDHRVATPIGKNPNCEPAKSYNTATDLNHYFENLPSNDSKKFFSIKFNDLIDDHKTLLNRALLPGDSFTTELKLLQELRNSEQHFYVDSKGYLSENEFKLLHNFMVNFYKVLIKYRMFRHFGIPDSSAKHLIFDRALLTNFSYKDALRSSRKVNKIAQLANDLDLAEFYPSTSYEIALSISNGIPELENFPFNELWEYIDVLSSFSMINVVQNGEEYIPTFDYSCGNADPEFSKTPVYVIKINLT